MGLALARGGIDAFLSGEPFPTLAVHQGYGRILAYPYYDDTVGTINAGMLVTRIPSSRTPELVHRLVKAHAQATDTCRTTPINGSQRAATFGTPLDILTESRRRIWSWPGHMDEAFVAKTKALGERMQALKVIDRQPDYDTLFDLRFVQRIIRSKRNARVMGNDFPNHSRAVSWSDGCPGSFPSPCCCCGALVARTGPIPAYLLPSPTDVVHGPQLYFRLPGAVPLTPGDLLNDARASLVRVVLGFALAAALGIPLGCCPDAGSMVRNVY